MYAGQYLIGILIQCLYTNQDCSMALNIEEGMLIPGSRQQHSSICWNRMYPEILLCPSASLVSSQLERGEKSCTHFNGPKGLCFYLSTLLKVLFTFFYSPIIENYLQSLKNRVFLQEIRGHPRITSPEYYGNNFPLVLSQTCFLVAKLFYVTSSLFYNEHMNCVSIKIIAEVSIT